MASLLQTKRVIWAVVFALVTLVALLSHFSGKRYVAAVDAVEHTLSVEAAIGDVLSLLKDAETGQRGYLLAGDPHFLEPLALARKDIPPRFAELKRLTQSDPQQTRHLQAVEELMREKYAFIDETVAARRTGDLEAALSMIRTGRGKELMDSLRRELDQMSQREGQSLQTRKREARAAQQASGWGIGIGSLAWVSWRS